MTEHEAIIFYGEIIEYFEEEGICSTEYFRGYSEFYATIVATIAIEETMFSFEHYEPFKAYARAYYRSRHYRIMPTGEITIH